MIEPLFLPGASRMNPNALIRKIRRLAETHNPESLTIRHERAVTRRDVWFFPLPDGMAQIGATLPAIPAKALFDSLDQWARLAQKAGEPSTALTPTGKHSRSLNNYRADVLMDLLHETILHPTGTCTNCNCNCEHPNTTSDSNDSGNSNTGNGKSNNIGSNSGGNGGNESTSDGTTNGSNAVNTNSNNSTAPGDSPTRGMNASGSVSEQDTRFWAPAVLNVSVPAMVLLGQSDEPGMLEGYGPIPAEQARELAAGSTSWYRILTHPVTKTRLSVGRERYRPPTDIARIVRLNDPVCTGIGCDHPAKSCELDHTIPFYQNRYNPDGTLMPKGETSVENLRPRHEYCHHIKDRPDTGWKVEPESPTQTKTTTPTGRIYLHTQNNDPPPF